MDLQTLVVDHKDAGTAWSADGLRDIFQLNLDTNSETRDQLNCVKGDDDDAYTESPTAEPQDACVRPEADYDDLSQWEQHEVIENVPDPILVKASQGRVSFVFEHLTKGALEVKEQSLAEAKPKKKRLGGGRRRRR